MHDATRSLRFASLGLLMMAASSVATAQQPNLVGTWEWTRKKSGCVERLDFRDDGTVAIRGGGTIIVCPDDDRKEIP